MPLASFLPGLLAAAGILATFIRKLSKNNIMKKCFTIFSIVLLLGSVFLFYSKYQKLNALNKDSILTPKDKLPEVIVLHDETVHFEKVTSKQFELVWSKLINDKVYSQIQLQNDEIYLGTLKGKVFNIHSTDGLIKYEIQKSQPILARPFVHKDLIILSEGAHHSVQSSLSVYDSKIHKVIWQREIPGHIEMDGVIDQKKNIYYFGAGPSGVWGLHLTDGKVMFHDRCGHVDATPIIYENALYVNCGVDDNKKLSQMIEYDLKTGFKKKSSANLQGDPWGVPIINDKNIYVLTGVGQIGDIQENEKGYLHKINLDLNIIKSVELKSMPLFYLDIINDSILFTLKDGTTQIRDLDLLELRKEWNVGSPINTKPTIFTIKDKKFISFVTKNGKFLIQDLEKYKTIYETEIATDSVTSPFVKEDDIYVSTQIELLKFSGLKYLHE